MQRVLGPVKSSMGVLTPWLLGPRPLLAQYPLPFRLGEQRQEWQLSPLHRDMQLLEIASEPPPSQWGDGPASCSVPLGWGPSPQGVYIYIWQVHPPPPMLHACYTLEPKYSPSSCSLCPASPCWGGGGMTEVSS